MSLDYLNERVLDTQLRRRMKAHLAKLADLEPLRRGHVGEAPAVGARFGFCSPRAPGRRSRRVPSLRRGPSRRWRAGGYCFADSSVLTIQRSRARSSYFSSRPVCDDSALPVILSSIRANRVLAAVSYRQLVCCRHMNRCRRSADPFLGQDLRHRRANRGAKFASGQPSLRLWTEFGCRGQRPREGRHAPSSAARGRWRRARLRAASQQQTTSSSSP